MAENSAMAEAKGDPSESEGKREPKTRRKSSNPSFNMDELRELAELVNEHGFTDFEFENENIRVRLSKNAPAPAFQQTPVQYMTAPASQQNPQQEAQPTPEADPDTGLHKITSPIVGTFYRSPGPDKEPYVSEGSSVTNDSVVCIVEAMKLMNEIQAEVSGEVVKIYVENGQPVEYGQPLFGIRK